MENRSRERVALVIFLALVVIGGALLAAYFLTGRSWSVAATMVDDAAGSMESYSVVAFSGVIPPEEDDVKPGKGSSSASATSSAGSAASSSSASPTSSSASSSAATASDGASAARPGARGSSSSASGEVDPANTMLDAFGSSSGSVGDADLRSSILSIFEREDRKRAAYDGRVYVSDVRDLYALKGASGVTLNLDDPSRYAEPSVMGAGDKKVGVFSISGYISRARLKSVVSQLKDDGADSVICIAPRTSLLATFDGLDVVILTTRQEEGRETRDTAPALVVESPEIGEVGVVMLTSNNVPSYKVVKEL